MLKQLVCSDAPEQALRYHGFRVIAGVDEVGRGALFGPVVAAAVILPERMDESGAGGVEGLQTTDAARSGRSWIIRFGGWLWRSVWLRWMRRRSTG